MSSGDGRRIVTPEEVTKVINFIEQCMLHYLNKKEVIDILYQQQQIEPTRTRIVWQHLEEENPEFFRAYYLRVALKEQITKFNSLLEQQARMMNLLNLNAVAPPAESTGSHVPQTPTSVDVDQRRPGTSGLGSHVSPDQSCSPLTSDEEQSSVFVADGGYGSKYNSIDIPRTYLEMNCEDMHNKGNERKKELDYPRLLAEIHRAAAKV